MTASELVAGDLAGGRAPGALPLDTTWHRPGWTIGELEAAKAGRTISVVLPALNEEATIESVIDSISPLVDGLVDELIVLDSGSTDDTEIRAIASAPGLSAVNRRCPRCRYGPAKVRHCGVHWRPPAATSWCSSTQT